MESFLNIPYQTTYQVRSMNFNTFNIYHTFPCLQGGCHSMGPMCNPRQTSRSKKPVESYDKLQEKNP